MKPRPDSLRVLQLCHKPPRPARDGGCLAIDALSTGLRALGHRVQILSACTHKHPCAETLLDANYVAETGFVGVDIDTRLKAVDALASLVSGESYNISRFYTPAMDAKLREVMRAQNFDVVVVESLFMAPYLKLIRSLSDGLVILRAHNVEHRIWTDLALTTPGLTRRTYLRLLAGQLENFEVNHLNAFDGILAISAEDAAVFRELGCTIPIEVAPFGLDLSAHRKPVHAAGALAFHLGAMDWEPNIRGVKWLVEEVWPLVRAAVPEARLQLAGKAFPVEFPLPDGAAGIEVLGEVDDARTLFDSGGVMLIPLLSGSGMRIKAIEGAAAGLSVVSTPIGAEGLSPAPPFQIAADARGFADAIIADMLSPEQAAARGQEARAWAEAHYSNRRIVANFARFCMKELGL